MKRPMRKFAKAKELLFSGVLAAAFGVTTTGLAHDPDTFLKGDARIKNGFTDNGNVEAKRARNTGRGMPSIRMSSIG